MKVSLETRKKLADAFLTEQINWSGRLGEVPFLMRLFDIKSMASLDPRYSSAIGDINQHRVTYLDWDNDWIFKDRRFNLLETDDDIFIKFLCEILHPIVRLPLLNTEQDDLTALGGETKSILEIFNHYLEQDNIEIVPQVQKIGKPIFIAIEKEEIGKSLTEKQIEIIDYLSSDYIKQQIDIMQQGIETSPYDAIGKSKELIETICKEVLQRQGKTVDNDLNLIKLVKETNKSIKLVPPNISNSAQAESSVRQILNGIASAIQGITELRNNFGSGHGHDANFQGLESNQAKLCVGFTTEFARYYLYVLKSDLTN